MKCIAFALTVAATLAVLMPTHLCAAETTVPPAEGGPFAGSAPGAPSADPTIAKKLEAAFAPCTTLIQGWLDHHYYDGASLIVVQGDATLYRHYFGTQADGSVEYIASAGKWLAAATIMTVVDSGRLGLDDPASKWLPQLTGEMGTATLRQMMSHTSGYPPYQPDGHHADDYQTLLESVTNLALLAPIAKPGEHWAYGGLALQAAGRMAEVASGKDWETLFQDNIAKPLGMRDTHFTPVDSGGFGHTPMLGGGARSSLRDYSRFLAMISADGLFDGKRILSSKAVAAMQANQVGVADIAADDYLTHFRGQKHHGIYGLGEWREIVNADDKALVISSPSWAGTFPWIDHRHQVYGFFLGHIDVKLYAQFNPMYASSALPNLVETAVLALGK